MSPLAFGLPLALPTLAIASRVAAGGLSFLQSVVGPAATATAPKPPTATSIDPVAQSLQRSLADEIRRAGFGAALPVEVADNGAGGIRVLSDSPERSAIEQRLNASPFLVQQFQAWAQKAAAAFQLTVPAVTGLDASA